MLLVAAAWAQEPVSETVVKDPNMMAAPPVVASSTAPDPPGFVRAVPHPTTEPLMPQRYRTVSAGEYPCAVGIHVDASGKVSDIDNNGCDDDAFWALATAIVQWRFDPATQDGTPVASVLPYLNVFEVKTWLPRKHIVGFVGGAVNAGGAGWFGAEFRIHLGETLSFTAGADLDHDYMDNLVDEVWVPTFRADVALSSRRRHFEHRGIYGATLGGFGDPYGAVGAYFAFRGELMTPVPGLSLGGDAGLAVMVGAARTMDDVGFWARSGQNPLFPWLRASVIWYAPVPRDQFVVVAREQDPTVYEPVIVVQEPPPDLDGEPFPGARSIHWSEMEPSVGEEPIPGPEFDAYPPGVYRCFVRALIGPDGMPKDARVAKCPRIGIAAAKTAVMGWRWLVDPKRPDVQAVFPTPFYIDRPEAMVIPARDVMRLVDGKAKDLPRSTPLPSVYAKVFVLPEWTVTRPTSSCYVDIDVDIDGKVTGRRWVSGDIDVQGRVYEALDQWVLYPVAIDGELSPARVRLSLCDA